MKLKAILFSLIACFAIVMTLMASAATGDLDVSIDEVEIKGVEAATIAGFAGETVPIKIVFTADDTIDNVRVKTWISGYRSDISDSTGRFDVIYDSTYTERLSLRLPSDIDVDEELTLYVRIETKTDYKEEEFDLRIQRESYNSEVLFVEVPQKVVAGTAMPVDVVLKNIGRHELEDMKVKVSIPALGIERRAYFGDLDAMDECEFSDDRDCDREDAAERVIYVIIPDNTESGAYDLEVSAYNSDAETTVIKSIVVEGFAGSQILSGVSSKDIAAGGEAIYDLVLVNSGKGIAVYSLIPEETRGITVSLDENIVTVPGQSSKVVKVRVKASDSVDEGTYNFAVNVHRGDELVQRVQLSANVTGRQINSLVILTVVLAIIFVVLLIVLIVLLTRKPEKTEFEETSYY